MKKSRFTETQIDSILKQADAGVPDKGICRQARHQRAHVLQVEGEVRRHGGVGPEAG